MTMLQLMNDIIKNYNEHDTNFATNTLNKIDQYYSSLKPSTSKIDPKRLGSKSAAISKLKTRLAEVAGPIDVDVDAYDTAAKKAFNLMSAKEQLKFQAQSIAMNRSKWVHGLQILPKNLEQLKMRAPDAQALQMNRNTIDTDKLRQESYEIDGNQLLAKISGCLTQPTKRAHLAAALLLVTGRRTIELLKTGDFSLSPRQNSNGYTCVFSGQAKEGLFPGGAYEIPLLAPYWLVKKAFLRLRQLYTQTQDYSNVDMNQSFAKSINSFTKKELKMTAHQLRGAYAMMTFALQNQKQMSLVGWISKILGHAQPAAAAYYQRMKVVDLTGPLEIERTAADMDIAPKAEDDEWKVTGVVDQKRIAGIKEMMEKRIRLTASSIRNNSGGTMPTITRVMNNNQARITAYNNSL